MPRKLRNLQTDPKTKVVSRLVELPLDREFGIPDVEPKNLVVDIQNAEDNLQTVLQRVARLGIELRMGIEIDVAVGTVDAARRSVLEVVSEERLIVVGCGDARREGSAVIRQPDVPLVRRRPLQARGSRAARRGIESGLGVGVGVVRVDPKPVPEPGQKSQALLPPDLESPDLGVGAIDRLDL